MGTTCTARLGHAQRQALAEHRTPRRHDRGQLDDDFRQIHILGLGAADISADGSTLAFCPHKVTQVFDVSTGKERVKFEVDPNGVATLALSPDGKRLAVGGRGKQIETRLPDGSTRSSSTPEHRTAVWDIDAKKVVETTSPGSWASELRFSLTASGWPIVSGEVRRSTPSASGRPARVARSR